MNDNSNCSVRTRDGDDLAERVTREEMDSEPGVHAPGQERRQAERTPYASRDPTPTAGVGPFQMDRGQSEMARWFTVVIFAVAMAWVESAVVYYLRTLLNRIEPYQPTPLPMIGGLGPAEMVREVATLIMLMAVGILAGRSWRTRFGYVAVAFGVWDIFYYIFLKVMCGWPHSFFDWDILFLLPLPWWGPVLAPVAIALLMLAWGTLSICTEELPTSEFVSWKSWALNFIGISLALYTFMVDAMRVSSQGIEGLQNLLPTRFNWSLFALALLFMAAPVIRLCWHIRKRAIPRLALIKMT